MEEKYGIRRFPYPAYGAQLAMAQVDPNSRRLILPTPSRLRGSAPAFAPGQTQHGNHGPRAQYPASLTLQHMSHNQQEEPLNGNGRPGNYYQLSQQLLRMAPATSASASPELQTFNTQDRSVQERNIRSDLLQQEPDQRDRASDALNTSAPEFGEAYEHRIQDIEANLLQAFAVSDDAAAPHEAANHMLVSRAFAAPSLQMTRPEIQTGKHHTQQPEVNETAFDMSSNEEATNTAFGLLLASNQDDDDDEANLDPALRRTRPTQGTSLYSPVPQAHSGEAPYPASVYSASAANFGQPQPNAGGSQPKVKPGLTVNTRVHLTKIQEMELAKEKIAHRPTQPLSTDHFTMDQYVGRPPSVLRERIPKPQQDTRNWFSEFTADELLHHMHPDDMCGAVIIEIAKQYSGSEIAGFANELYKLRGGAKGDVSTNGFTKRVTLAVKDLCEDVKADRQRVLDALSDVRSLYRETGTPGTKAETIVQGIRDRRAAQASSAIMRAPAVHVLQPSGQAAAGAPTTLPISAATLSQTSSNNSGQGSTGMRFTARPSKRKRSNTSDENEEAPKSKREKHTKPDLDGQESDKDAEFEYE